MSSRGKQLALELMCSRSDDMREVHQAMTRSKDLAYTSDAPQKVIAPTEEDWIAVERIFLCVSTPWKSKSSTPKGGSVVNKAYSDASWADDSENVGGYVLMLPTVLSSGGAIAGSCCYLH
jgi:hypothetical protein